VVREGRTRNLMMTSLQRHDIQLFKVDGLNQWFPTFFNAFFHLLILELLIPPLSHNLFFIPPLLNGILYRLPFTCRGVAYSSSSYACMDYK